MSQSNVIQLFLKFTVDAITPIHLSTDHRLVSLVAAAMGEQVASVNLVFRAIGVLEERKQCLALLEVSEVRHHCRPTNRENLVILV